MPSLYIHMPWCLRKCPYCDFNSHQRPDTLPEEAYINALIEDLNIDAHDFPQTTLSSIFIGGGTPSLFSARSYARLFEVISKQHTLAHNLEITLEANPGSVEQQRFMDYRAIGINRLSLGIQSFHPEKLKALGRVHNDVQAHLAIDAAKKAKFEQINLDIMYALPHQSMAEGMADLKQAIAHEPTHLSWYQLTLEPNTVFYKHPPPLPQEEEACALEEAGHALLAEHGYRRYEISAFCQDDHMSQHNLNYWLFGDYYGIGAGAHGKLTHPTTQTIYRTQKKRQPNDYLDHRTPFRNDLKALHERDLVFEFMLNTTRLEQPIANALFEERTHLSFECLQPTLRLAEQKGMIQTTSTHWQVTQLGRRFTNDLQALFL